MDIIKLFSGGFPMTIETLAFIQDAYTKPLSALSNMAGDKSILDGVVLSGSDISEGYFTHNKEVLYFKASTLGAVVKIVEKTVQVPYNEDTNLDGNLDLKDAYVTRYGTTNDPLDVDEVLVDQFNYSDLVRITNFRNLTPVGAVVLWFDAGNTPAGWAVCDGTNGTPDLSDKFIKGAGIESAVNTSSGSRTKTLTSVNLPAHTHTIPAHTHEYRDGYYIEAYSSGGIDGNEFVGGGKRGSSGTDSDNSYIFYKNRITNSGGSGNTSSVGNATAFNVEPLHYAAIYIQFKGL
ncbi:structural protein [Flavobacterium phage vB_FspM_lotta8-1]|uniref:Structural protein n=2 Tax=Pippivirus lotta TaxID=2844291 RepID=A0A6B9L8X0_9CAUD|nr:tail fiber protein [Flavobacterium phage vB_FspM_lotta8-1]QHB38507.1 structural protein [Flavobacterium phage vB_FspM_lotta8-1]QHB38560.1 structural protein [Flavobacterium phage vB_FspM_lotta8-2]